MPLGVLLVMKTLEDRWYVVINAYQFTVFEIWRDSLVLSYIACPRYPYIRVYRLYDIAVVQRHIVPNLISASNTKRFSLGAICTVGAKGHIV